MSATAAPRLEVVSQAAHRPGCQTRSGSEPPPGWRVIERDKWIRAMRPVRLTATEKVVVLSLAQYANKSDGKSAHPGTPRLAWESCTSVITVRRTLDKLQKMWLIHCHSCGNGRGHATEWWLTVHDQMDPLSLPFDDWAEIHA